MDRFTGSTSHVPAFLGKLWRIVDEPSTNDLICWSETGKTFIIRNQSKFARDLLPLYYKHNNMASFVRQLNMYGFHKVISMEQGGLKVDRDEMEFAHPYFFQGNEDALEFIKRKISTSKIEDVKGRPENLNKVLVDVRQMKGRQEVMDSKLVSMKRENEALWRELSQLRQKHAKQQQIVSKLLQFLVSMMSSSSHRISFKRRLPLMLNDSEGDSSKPTKISRPNTSSVVDTLTETNNGPVIHEVFEQEDSLLPDLMEDANGSEAELEGGKLVKVEDLLQTAVSKTMEDSSIINLEDVDEAETDADPYVTDKLSIQTVDSSSNTPPREPTSEAVTANGLPSLEESMQLSRPEDSPISKAVLSPICPDGINGHLDDVQTGLDTLKDLLQGSTYNLDSATLSGLFDLGSTYETDFPLYEFTHNDKEVEKDVPLGITYGHEPEPVTESGSDLVSYNPCLFELADDDSQFLDTPTKNLFLDEELDMMLTTDRNKLHESVGGFS